MAAGSAWKGTHTARVTYKTNEQLPAVISSCTYNVLVIVRKANVGDVRGVPEVPLVFGLLGETAVQEERSSTAVQKQ